MNVRWLKARDSLLVPAPGGREFPDGRAIAAEAGLVLTVEGEVIVIEGSYARLLKTLEHARATLLAGAPALAHVIGAEVAGETEVLTGDRLIAARAEGWELVHGLRCPYPDCAAVTWDGEEEGVRVVDTALRWHPFGYRHGQAGTRPGITSVITGSYDHDGDYATDHFECESCDRPVTLPDDVEEDGW